MEGVNLYPLKIIANPKGNIYHALKSTDPGYDGFGEVYFSKIVSSEVKGWQKHLRLTLNLIVPSGIVKFVIYDDRENSKTKGEFQEFILSPEGNYSRLTVSPGLWMAFAGVSDKESIVLDIINESHDPAETEKKELSEFPYNFNV